MLRALLLGLVLVCSPGCLKVGAGESIARSRDWMARMTRLRGGLVHDSLRMELILVRLPAGDPYLNTGLWQEIDEQVVAEGRRPVLQQNGLRVGVTSANLSTDFQKLLTAEESCVARRQKTAQEGQEIFLPLGGEHETTVLTVFREGETLPLRFHHAQLGLVFHLTPGSDQGVCVRLQPALQHGPFGLLPRLMSHGDIWNSQPGRPQERFSFAGCELEVAPNELLVLGCWPDRPDTLGQRCFLHEENGRTWQHLLVARVYVPGGRSLPGHAAAPNPQGREPVPLAIQSAIPRRSEPVLRP